MFKKVIGRKCKSAGCALEGELQDMGLMVCPECGLELELEKVDDTRAMAIAAVTLAIAGSLSGLTGYGLLAKGLNPVRTVEWLMGRIQVSEFFHTAAATEWVSGVATFYGDAGPIAQRPGDFLYEVKDGRRTSTFRGPLLPNTGVTFDVTTVGPAVSSLYLLHRGDTRGRVFTARDLASSRSANRTISIPGGDELIRLVGGAATEHFVLIAAKKPLAAMEALRRKAEVAGGEKTASAVSAHEVDAVVAPLERDPEAYVLHIFIPHS
jgi:hypothetical protein